MHKLCEPAEIGSGACRSRVLEAWVRAHDSKRLGIQGPLIAVSGRQILLWQRCVRQT